MASPFFGGPERQVLGMSRRLPSRWKTVFASFAEGGKAEDFLGRAEAAGFEAICLQKNWPDFRGSIREVAELVKNCEADLLCTNGYKPDILGVAAARQAGVPSVAIAHGWTSATWKVRLNEWLDQRAMCQATRVVGVSEKQTERCLHAGVRRDRVVTIPNAVAIDELGSPNEEDRQKLLECFVNPPQKVLAAAGRLSPEKGFDLLIEAIAQLGAKHPEWGFVIFGGGPLEGELKSQIERLGVQRRIVLGGFRNDLNQILPQADGFVLSSRTEGLPVALLEAMAAGLPSVATTVGGTPEVVGHEVHGLLAPPEDAEALAATLDLLLGDESLRQRLGQAARERVAAEFSHELQAERFATLFDQLTATGSPAITE